MNLIPRTTRLSPYEPGTAAPPWLFQNIDIYRTAEPQSGERTDDYGTYPADGFFVLIYDAQGIPVPWMGATRWELVLPKEFSKEDGQNYMWVRPGRKTSCQKSKRLLDIFNELRNMKLQMGRPQNAD